MRIWILIGLLALMVPCQACGPSDDAAPCSTYSCGSYRMNGEWRGDLHAEIWYVDDDGTISNFQETDAPGILRVSSTGCAAMLAGRAAGLYTDTELIIDTEYTNSSDDAGNYRNEWAWWGQCSLEGDCTVNVEVMSFNGGTHQLQRGLFVYTNLVRRGSE